MNSLTTPLVFVAHGSPMFGIAAGEFGETLGRFATRFPRPAAIVIVSAHWGENGDEIEEIASGFQYANLSLFSDASVPQGGE